MAIQKEKIPSPSDIKKGPVKFTEEEIKNLKNLQNQVQQITIRFGQLHMSKLRLEETESVLKQKLSELQKEEIALAKSLSDKYGEGSLDIVTETFTPSK